MDSRDIDRIQKALNIDTVRRLLIEYFVKKGYSESFDKLIYPPSIQDITLCIPHLSTKLEIVPHALSIDPITMKQAKLGWNLFVLGSQRMFLGETQHYDLANLARQFASGQMMLDGSEHVASFQTTPRKVINFIVSVLRNSRNGYIDFKAPIQPMGSVLSGPASAGLQGQTFKTSGSALR